MSELSSLVGVGPKTSQLFESIGITTPLQLLHYYPHRYLDFSSTRQISEAEIGTPTTFSGEIISFQNIYTRTRKNIQRAVVKDKTGTIILIWFNQSYLQKSIKVGDNLHFAGNPSLYQNKITIVAPLIGHKTGKVIPIYHQTAGLKSSLIEKIIHQNLHQLLSLESETLPKKILDKYNLLDTISSLKEVHQPTSTSSLLPAKDRIDLNQSLSLVATSQLLKDESTKQKPAYTLSQDPPEDFLPYPLSPSQKLAWDEIKKDLLSLKPAHRLLSGDVGSGKTIIAILSANLVSHNNNITLLIAPTQVLASQHFHTFKKVLSQTPILLLDNKSKLKHIPTNAVIISTHAAFYQSESLLKKVALLIVDEQHKFGVVQRNFLNKFTNPPHSLSLTATPIPRTLALSIYGHLQVSTLSHLSTWKPVKTFLVSPNKQNDCYEWLAKHISETHEQAFIVCPIIEDSEVLTEVKSATSEFEAIKKIFPKLRLRLIHSKVSVKERQEVFELFGQGKIDILVTTPIIEVGIDFPNATTIIIQSAQRFGLASLHQLRGRVGRGQKPGYCYLFSQSVNPRLEYLTTHYEGWQLAEFDLRNRGQGQIFSTLQHGHFQLNAKTISLATKIVKDLSTTSFDFSKLTTLSISNSKIKD